MRRSFVGAVLASLLLVPPAGADPCGMVPPLRISDKRGPVIERIGIQRTYVSFRNGIETMVLRPGFQGKIDDFGMLIPFPSPPAVRKIDDNTFTHIEAALVPPKIRLSVQRIHQPPLGFGELGGLGTASVLGTRGSAMGAGANMHDGGGRGLGYHEVRVVREEAVGMYQVAVLEAGSPAALSRWMGDNGYRYPDGMDDVTQEYVEDGWCFVAVKAQIGAADQVAPRPGMRSADPKLPNGSTFSGHVQGMGFRFETDEPVIPMRLSVFNGPDPRNVVYMLSDEPMVISGLPETVQVRHRSGRDLLEAVAEPLALDVLEGEVSWLSEAHQDEIRAKRQSSSYVWGARNLFAADLLALRTGSLALDYESEATSLLNISEALGLRGPEIDALLAEEGRKAAERAVDGALDDLNEMHMTVMDGVFPAELLRDQNLTFEVYAGPRDTAHTRQDPLQPGNITGRAIINTATNTTSLSWRQPDQRTVTGSLAAPQLLNHSGPLEQALILSVIRRYRKVLQYCYNRTLQQNPNLGGAVLLRAMIAPDGSVQSSGITRGLGDAQFEHCLVSRFRRMRFPASEAATLIQVQLSFSPDF